MPDSEIDPPAKKKIAKKKTIPKVTLAEAGKESKSPALENPQESVKPPKTEKSPKTEKPSKAQTSTTTKPLNSSQESDSLNSSEKFQIYNTPGLQSHPTRSPRDLVKVLIRNPLEAFVYWEIGIETFERVLLDFGKPAVHEIQLKLKLAYHTPEDKEKEEWFDVHPLSNSYYCKLHSPAKSVRAEIYASFQGKVRLFLETKGGDLPTGGETRELDPEWIHPEWIRLGLVKKTKEGKMVLSDEYYAWSESELGDNTAFQPFGSSHPTSPGSSWGKR